MIIKKYFSFTSCFLDYFGGLDLGAGEVELFSSAVTR